MKALQTYKIGICAALLLFVSAMMPPAANAQTIPAGWVRTWNASGPEIVKIVIAGSGPAATIHVWGKCTPTPCDWGTVPLGLYALNVSSPTAITGMATFTTSFAIKTVIVRPAAGLLRVETLTNFTDHSARSCYDTMQVLH